MADTEAVHAETQSVAFNKRADKLEADLLEQRNYYAAKIDRIEAANHARERIA